MPETLGKVQTGLSPVLVTSQMVPRVLDPTCQVVMAVMLVGVAGKPLPTAGRDQLWSQLRPSLSMISLSALLPTASLLLWTQTAARDALPELKSTFQVVPSVDLRTSW